MTSQLHDPQEGNPVPNVQDQYDQPLFQSSSQQPQAYQSKMHENFGSSIRGDGESLALDRTESVVSAGSHLPTRGGTLKKRNSLSRKGSLKRSSSRRSSRAGSVRSLALGERERIGGVEESQSNSAFYTPVPLTGNPTEILTARFQVWRKVLKDLITYFREVQTFYEHRSKSVLKVSNVINNMPTPSILTPEGGLDEAVHTLRNYHKAAFLEANKAKEIETGVINQLTGLRSDLSQKIKEIKNLSGDFKNSVEKEMDGTRRAVHNLQEALGLVEIDSGAATGKGDPFIVKLGVDKQVERQIDEENYLHRAFLNLEGSGRELESIVVGEIQKAYNAYAAILKREADEAYEVVENLRTGPIAMPKDHEWSAFVERDAHFVDPRIPVRRFEDIQYPGRDHPDAAEVRSGMLERKSKYLKSYTPGWYVLSSTHLHEFKSADRISSQPPVMSLYLPDQKLGTHSQPISSSHKFMLKGRQTGSMHRGHSWVFRAESHDTMLAWYEDMKILTEKSGAERSAFVRQHARSVSNSSQRAGSISSDGALEEDEADQVPYSGNASTTHPRSPEPVPRPSPGGRFPSDLAVDRDLRSPGSVSSVSDDPERETIAVPGHAHGSHRPAGGAQTYPRGHEHQHGLQSHGGFIATTTHENPEGGAQASAPLTGGAAARNFDPPQSQTPERHDSTYGEWMGTGATAGGAGATLLGNNQGTTSSEPSHIGSDGTIPTRHSGATDATVASSTANDAAIVRRSRSLKKGQTGGDSAARPAIAPHASAKSASDLHVPGEFPRTPATSQG